MTDQDRLTVGSPPSSLVPRPSSLVPRPSYSLVPRTPSPLVLPRPSYSLVPRAGVRHPDQWRHFLIPHSAGGPPSLDSSSRQPPQAAALTPVPRPSFAPVLC